MPQPQPPASVLSQRMGQTALLALCLLIPLVMHTGVYNFALLPKRLLLQCTLFIVAILWVHDLSQKRTQLYTSPFYLPLLAFLCLSILATTQATSATTALVALSHQLTFILLFVLTTHLFTIDRLTDFLRISAIVGCIVSLIGILEARGVESLLPLSNGRPSATFAYRNFAATFLIMNIPLVVVFILRARKPIEAYLGILSTALMVTFLVYTRTRGAWVGFASAIVLTAMIFFFLRQHITWKIPATLKDRTVQTAFAIACIVTLTLSLLPPQIASQQSRAIDDKKVALLDALSFATTPEADRGRQSLWIHTLEIIRDHPILGVGPGNWQHTYPAYDGGDMLRKDSAPLRPHNDYLQIASETGLLAFLVYVWFLITIAITLIRIIKKPVQPDHAIIALAFGTSMLAMLGHGMVSFPMERVPPSFLFWFGLGILTYLARDPSAQPIASPLVQKSALLIPLLLAGATYIGYQNMQFDRHYLRAFEYFRGGDMRGVLSESTKALEWGAFDTQAYLLQGNAYQSAGMTPQAQQAYQLGLQDAPHNIQLLGALGNTYAATNKLDQAEKLYRQALSIYPGYHEIDNNLGGIYQKRGDLPQAIATYKGVIEKTGEYVDAYTNLGLAYVTLDSTAQAIQAYESALRLVPNDPVIYHDLGEAYYQHARKDPNALPIAQKAFERFLQNWKGSQAHTKTARQRLADIQSRLAK